MEQLKISKGVWSKIGLALSFLLIIFSNFQQSNNVPFLSPISSAFDKKVDKNTMANKNYEVFGFAPYWSLDNLDNVDFKALTTLAYFDAPVDSNGNIDTTSAGYQSFISDKATKLFRKAHNNGTRVVLTLTQMDASQTENFLSSGTAQTTTINQTLDLVKKRGIDGINVDFEYFGGNGEAYQQQFSDFISRLTKKMHAQDKNSKVTVSIYASAVISPRIYDVGQIAKNSDGIFMMAYDYATASSDNAMPTAPLYGHKSGKYWYDVSTAVEDFLTKMPAEKLILGVPYYGVNYVVNKPTVQAETLPYYSWKGQPMTQTYSIVQNNIMPTMAGISNFISGWDDDGKVGYKAYYNPQTGAWRMVFVEDKNSLALKYDFAKQKELGGVGIWALGFDEGRSELWTLIKQKFGTKEANPAVQYKFVSEI